MWHRLACHTCSTEWHWCNPMQHRFIYVQPKCFKDRSNDLVPQSCSGDNCSDPEFQCHAEQNLVEGNVFRKTDTMRRVCSCQNHFKTTHSAPSEDMERCCSRHELQDGARKREKSQARCLQDSNEITWRAN